MRSGTCSSRLYSIVSFATEEMRARPVANANPIIAWEDSMEIQASLYWTPDFIDKFTAGRGYNPTKYLPLMFSQYNSFHGDQAPYNTTFHLKSFNNAEHSKYLEDYRITLTEGYKEYLQALESWAESLGISHSCQVAYNLPLDLVSTLIW